MDRYTAKMRQGAKADKWLVQVYAILDEVFLAGEIEETSKQVVLTRLEHLDKLEWDSFPPVGRVGRIDFVLDIIALKWPRDGHPELLVWRINIYQGAALATIAIHVDRGSYGGFVYLMSTIIPYGKQIYFVYLKISYHE